MRSLLLMFIALVSLPFGLAAQRFHGRVYDANSGLPAGPALVTNMRTGSMWLGDSAGHVAFSAEPGDEVVFQHKGHQDYALKIAGYNDAVVIALQRAPIELQGVEVISPMARYLRDSAFNHQFFHKALSYAHSQVGLSTNGVGIGAEGLVSQLALIASGKRKAARRLELEMAYLEGMQFNNVRYTPTLVATQTGLSDSASEQFILHHPIPNDFLRVASELELKMRVREMYREETFGKKEESIGGLDSVRHENGAAASR